MIDVPFVDVDVAKPFPQGIRFNADQVVTAAHYFGDRDAELKREQPADLIGFVWIGADDRAKATTILVKGFWVGHDFSLVSARLGATKPTQQTCWAGSNL